MPSNNRIFFASHYCGLAPLGTPTFTAAHVMHGVQSVGMSTTFNLEQAFELGQLSLYENIENIPDIEVTVTKLFDGWKPLYFAATPGATGTSLASRSSARAMFGLSIFPDTNDRATGNPTRECVVSGTYLSSWACEIPTEGNSTETVTLVAHDKQWDTGTKFIGFMGGSETAIANVFAPGSGTIQRRQHVQFSYGSGITFDSNGTPQGVFQGYRWGTVLPRQIPGITTSGTNPFTIANNAYDAHIARIAINTNLGREALNELGHRSPYFRYVNFPIAVNCDIDVISSDGDAISATDAGTLGNGQNLQNESIRISLLDTTFIDLGIRNKLSSVTYQGGDATGGNVQTTYSYQNFNDLTIYHAQQNA